MISNEFLMISKEFLVISKHPVPPVLQRQGDRYAEVTPTHHYVVVDPRARAARRTLTRDLRQDCLVGCTLLPLHALPVTRGYLVALDQPFVLIIQELANQRVRRGGHLGRGARPRVSPA